MSKQATSQQATIVKIHARHYIVSDENHNHLFETMQGFGDLRDRNLKAECEQWLADNGYFFKETTPHKRDVYVKGKRVIVRWQAVYETTINVPYDATEQTMMDEAANINITVPNSEYQTDTWEVDSIKEV